MTEFRADPLRTHAVVVGIERYKASDIADRPGLARTSDRFAAWLRVRGVPDENIIQLGGSDARLAPPATRQNVDTALTEDIPGRRGDLLWIFWVGHGVLDTKRRRRLLLADSTDRNKHTLDVNDLLMLYGSTYLDHFRQQIVVVDACQTDLPGPESMQWARPLSLPEPRERATGRLQRVWLASSAGEPAAYSATRESALFSDAVLDSVEAGGELYWCPPYETVRDALKRKLEGAVQLEARRQNPVVLTFSSEDGVVREETIAAPEPVEAPPSPFRDHPGVPAEDPTLAAYLRWLIAKHSYVAASLADHRSLKQIQAPLAEVPWTGVVVEDTANHHARHSEVAYLRASAERRGSEAAEIAARPFPTGLSPTVHVDRLDLSGHPSQPAEHVLESMWRCIVLGDPGSGKTTLARLLTLRAASHQSPSTDPRWRLPVLCRAADLVRAIESAEGELAGMHALAALAINAGWNSAPPTDPLSRDQIASTGLSRLAAQAADHGRLLLIIDGLDEVPTTGQRADLVALLNRVIERDGLRTGLPAESAGNQLMVTSRLVGYYAYPLSELVHQMILQPMDPSAAVETGCWWLRHFTAAAGNGERRAAVLEEQFRSVVAGLEGSASLLAANPYLLVSLISAVTSGSLDDRRLRGGAVVRSDLYRFMVDAALARAAIRFPGVPDKTLLDLQAAVAYQMHRTFHSGLLPQEELASCVAAALSSLPRPAPCEAGEALAYVQGLGLMTNRGPDQYGFLHLTLEEYLAGRHLVADESAAAKIQEHLSDPRWVEPIRLALGHLGQDAPRRLDGLLTALLTGPTGEYAARLLAASLTEFAEVRAAHVEAAITAALTADSRRAALSGLPSGTAEVVAPLLASQVVLKGGDSPADVVRRSLAHALGAGSMWVVAAAARTVESFRLFDRQIAEALFRAQERDGSEYGWSTVRALQSMLAPASDSQVSLDDTSAAAIWTELGEGNQDALAAVRVTKARRPAAPATDRLLLPRYLTPFRAALDEALVRRIESGPAALLRVVLCLYGVVAFHDTRRWIAEKARLTAELTVHETPQAARHSAAIRLDTVVASELAKESGDRLLVAHRITADSPLTSRFVKWLQNEEDVSVIAERLRALAVDEGADDRTRGDALAAWIALGTDDGLQQAANVIGEVGEGTRQRLVWRMDRACFVLADAAARLSIGSVVEAFDEMASAAPAPTQWGDPYSAAANSAQARLQPEDGRPTEPPLEAAATALCVLIHGGPANTTHTLPAVLDTAGQEIMRQGPLGLARALAGVHHVEEGLVRYPVNWKVDPFAPRPAEPLAEALTSLHGLTPRMAYVRCWLLDRLAPLLKETGFAIEAICLALRAYPHDPVSATRTVRRLASLVEGLGLYVEGVGRPEDPVLPDRLAALADRLPNGYARARATVWVAELRNRRQDPLALIQDNRIHKPEECLRLIELAVSLGVTDWSPELFRQTTAYASRATTPVERALGYARIAVYADHQDSHVADRLLAESIAQIPYGQEVFLRDEGLWPYIEARRTEVRADSRPQRQTERFRQVATKVLGEVSAVAPTGGGWKWESHLQAALVATIYGREVDDKPYFIGVTLDTVGSTIARAGGLSIAELLATAHLLAQEFGEESEDWNLDLNAPVTASRVPEALTALDGLAPRLTFVRCWFLDRMAGQLAVDGFAAEAICVALQARRSDSDSVTRTVRRLAAAIAALKGEAEPGLDANGTVALAQVALLADAVADPYARARALLRLALLKGDTFHTDQVLDLAAELSEPLDRLRLIELAVSLKVATWSPRLAEACASYAERIVDPLERLLAYSRLSALGGSPEHQDRIRKALEAIAEDEFDDAAEQDEAEDEWPKLAESLLAFDTAWQLRQGAPREQIDAWAVLSCAALCKDALDTLHSVGPEALWRELASPENREESALALRRYGQERLLPLGTEAAMMIDLLLREGRADLAAGLLAVSRTQRRLPEVEAWRAVADQRIADLATLLVIENGRLDEPGVAALRRLLSDPDDMVRLRTAVATSVKSRGGSGEPPFTSSSVGVAALAGLARLTRICHEEHTHLTTDVWWALTDVVHNSPSTLTATLDMLVHPEERRLFLRSCCKATPETLAALSGLLPELNEPDQMALLHALQTIAYDPRRAGVDENAIAEMVRLIRPFAEEALDEVYGQILCLYGLAQPITDENLLQLSERASMGLTAPRSQSRAVAVGACHGLGFMAERALGSTANAAGAGLAEAFETLRSLAVSGDAILAEAAVTALSRAGRYRQLFAGCAPGDIAWLTVLWGLLGALNPFVVGDEEARSIRRICRFILRPPGLTGAEAARITVTLIEALLDRAVEAMYTPIESRFDDYGATTIARHISAHLSVLAELAHTAPAEVRRRIDEGYPGFRALLVNEFSNGGWVTRQSAARLLVVLGRADERTIKAILDTSEGSDIIGKGLFTDLAWFDEIQPDGFALLIAAAGDPRPSRCYLAVRMLASLVNRGILDDRDHVTALDAIQRSLDSRGGEEPFLREDSGRILGLGTYGDAIRRAVTGLVGPELASATAGEEDNTVLEVPDVEGRPLSFVVPSSTVTGNQVLLEHQLQYYSDSESREVPFATTNALRALLGAALAAKVPVEKVLNGPWRSAE